MTAFSNIRGTGFLRAMKQRILLLDGSTGVEFQRMKLTENEVRGRRFMTHAHPLAANFDILTLSRPELVERVHRNYLEAGADIIETDTFNATSLSQKEFGTDHLIYEINLSGARIASRLAAEYTRRNPDQPRFVAGSMGPTALSASLATDVTDVSARAVDFETLAAAWCEQARGLIDGGVDFLLIETAFDLLNAKAAAEGARRAMALTDTEIPLVFSFTISDTSGRILSGHSPEAILTALAPYAPAALGFNCSAGPDELIRHTRDLAAISPFPVIFYPNAGLPDRMGNYDIAPGPFADSFRSLIADSQVNIVGGCCGSGPEHISALRRVLDETGGTPHTGADPGRLPWLAGLEAFYDDRGFINVGERCNVAGSRKFLRLINEKKYDEALAIARKQVEDGAMILDINMDDGMLDARGEMARFLRVLGSDPVTSSVPWMIDSSDFNVIREALINIGGRAIVNSISLKHGKEEFLRQAEIIRSYGAAVVVMLFDERGQADTLERKQEIAARAIKLLTGKAGFARRDIVIDPNVLTIATGMPEHDAYALWFIEAVRWINEQFPGVKTSGGVSNLSFAFRGNNPLRQSMHAVFLYHAIRAGLKMAIVDPGTKITYTDIEPRLLGLIEDAVLCRTPEAGNALGDAAGEFVAGSAGKTAEHPVETLSVERRLVTALLKGDDSSLAADIPEAVASVGNANAVVEDILMEGMEEVGRLFEAGKMFLPQVVKSARTMHRAVALLEPFLEKDRVSGASKGRFLVATVKGDVHDIGKNIAAVVLRCNNYEVIDLGVQVDADTIVNAVREHNPDFIALSGLISPSLEEMARILTVLRSEGISLPVFVGGAATSDIHTALRLVPAYGRGLVARVADASQDPVLASRLARDYDATVADYRNRYARLALSHNAPKTPETPAPAPGIDWDAEPLPRPSFTGIRTLPEIPVTDIIPFINWIYFYACWKIKPDTPEAAELRHDAGKMLRRFTELGATMRAQVAFYPAYSAGDDIHVEGLTLPMLRKSDKSGSSSLSLADYIAPDGYNDYLGCFTVTIGDTLRKLEASGGDDYERLLCQSLCDRLAEAASEWLHRQVRVSLWGYAPDEPLDMDAISHACYRGIRPAVGYPSIPDQMMMHKLMKLLDPEALDITITENGALAPSSTVAGFYFASPRARYF